MRYESSYHDTNRVHYVEALSVMVVSTVWYATFFPFIDASIGPTPAFHPAVMLRICRSSSSEFTKNCLLSSIEFVVDRRRYTNTMSATTAANMADPSRERRGRGGSASARAYDMVEVVEKMLFGLSPAATAAAYISPLAPSNAPMIMLSSSLVPGIKDVEVKVTLVV